MVPIPSLICSYGFTQQNKMGLNHFWKKFRPSQGRQTQLSPKSSTFKYLTFLYAVFVRRIVLKKCFVLQCSGSRPIFAWEKRKSGLEDAKINISVGALALNAHNEHFWQFFVFRRSIIEAASVLGGISKFGYVHFINDIAFHHTNCNCHWIYVRLGPISSINRVKTEFSPLFPQLK